MLDERGRGGLSLGGVAAGVLHEDPERQAAHTAGGIDGLELQVDAMTSEAAESFMAGDVFAANPIGVEFDPADLVARRVDGESTESLLAYPAR